MLDVCSKQPYGSLISELIASLRFETGFGNSLAVKENVFGTKVLGMVIASNCIRLFWLPIIFPKLWVTERPFNFIELFLVNESNIVDPDFALMFKSNIPVVLKEDGMV